MSDGVACVGWSRVRSEAAERPDDHDRSAAVGRVRGGRQSPHPDAQHGPSGGRGGSLLEVLRVVPLLHAVPGDLPDRALPARPSLLGQWGDPAGRYGHDCPPLRRARLPHRADRQGAPDHPPIRGQSGLVLGARPSGICRLARAVLRLRGGLAHLGPEPAGRPLRTLAAGAPSGVIGPFRAGSRDEAGHRRTDVVEVGLAGRAPRLDLDRRPDDLVPRSESRAPLLPPSLVPRPPHAVLPASPLRRHVPVGGRAACRDGGRASWTTSRPTSRTSGRGGSSDSAAEPART